MGFTYEIKTTTNGGNILTTTTGIDNILDGFVLEQNAGDERIILSGDLLLKHRELLDYTWSLSTRKAWFLVYYNSVLYDVFELLDFDEVVEEKYDLNTRIFESRLPSISGIFYKNIKQKLLEYEATSTRFNYALQQGIVSIDDVRILNSTGAQLTKLDVYGFSLGDVLANLAGKDNQDGFVIRNVTLNNIPSIGDDDLPILFRGDGYTIGITSLQDAINNTFYQNEDTDELYKLTWGDLFKLAIYGWNCFIKTTPVIESNTLKLDIEFVSKVKLDTSGASTKIWSKLRRNQRQYKLDGVILEGSNFTFVKREQEGNVTKFEIPIANPDQLIDANKKELYWVAGDAVGALNGSYQRYNVLDVSSQNRPYADESLIDQYYTEFFTNGDTYEGELLFGGEKLFDKITVPYYAGTETMQINKIEVEKRMAKVNGVVIKA